MEDLKMGMFNKITKAAKSAGHSVSKSTGHVASSASVAVQEQNELVALRAQVNVIEQELDSAYTQIGRKFVDYVVESGEMPGIDVADILKMMDPKLTKKMELEKRIIQLEKEITQKRILREKAAAEETFLEEKKKLDRALGMELLTQEEYMEKLYVAQKRLDNFESIRRVELQEEMGLITKDEKEEKLRVLME
jgi:hypothetical protein